MAEVKDINNQRDMDAIFAGVAADFRGIDWTPWLTRSMRMIEEEHAVMWAAQRDPEGEPWQPLAPSTVKRKGHSRILIETDRLRGSLTQQGHADGIREMFQEGGTVGMIFGTSVPYSLAHIRGDGGMLPGFGRLPKRDHVGIRVGSFDRMTEFACDHALQELKQ